VFLLFDGVAGVLPRKVLVVSAGSPCSVGRKPPCASRIAKCGAWGSLVCASGLLTLNSKVWSLGFTCVCQQAPHTE
jgi:hypothetical protein